MASAWCERRAPAKAHFVTSNVASPSIYDWDVNDVFSQLVIGGWAPPGFSHRARQHRVDGFALAGLTKEALRAEFGVRELGTIKHILRNIQRLKDGARSTFERPHSAPCHNVPHGRRQRQAVQGGTHTSAVTRTESGQAVLRASKKPHRLSPVASDATGGADANGDVGPASTDAGGGAVAVVASASRPTLHLEPLENAPQVRAVGVPPSEGADAVEGSQLTPPARGEASRRGSQVRTKLGILEVERRRTDIHRLFDVWEQCSDISRAGSGYIELDELREVLTRFYGWADGEKEEKAQELMRCIDLNADGLLDRDEFEKYMTLMTSLKSLRDFDHLMRHMRRAVTEASVAAETARRRAALADLFRRWDVDRSGYIDRNELVAVIVRYNDVTAREGRRSAAMVLEAWDRNLDGKLEMAEFLALFMAKADGLSPEEFDYVAYRIGRCAEDFQHDTRERRRSAFQPLAVSDLEEMWLTSTASTPLLMHGESVGPAMHLERLAHKHGMVVLSFLVTNSKHEGLALEALAKWGLGRGQWIFITVDRTYANADDFLREVGKAIRRDPTYLFHRKFRLWLMVNTPRLATIPPILRHDSIPICLDAVRQRRMGEHTALLTSTPQADALPNAALQQRLLFS